MKALVTVMVGCALVGAVAPMPWSWWASGISMWICGFVTAYLGIGGYDVYIRGEFMPLKPIVGEHLGGEVILHCHHKAIWPPIHSQLGDLEDLRDQKVIDGHKYEQLKTWKRVCGLHQMDADTCYACPLARMETTAGLQEIPKLDQPTRPLPPFAKSTRKQ